MKMHHAIYPDGTASADHYNLARAKDHTAVLAETQARYDRRQRATLASSIHSSQETDNRASNRMASVRASHRVTATAAERGPRAGSPARGPREGVFLR
jgi:hypothetical protein